MTLWLSDQARAEMLAEARSRRSIETGGGLFGYLAGADIVIDEASVAAGKTRRTRASFRPDPDDLQARIDEVIARSDGVCHLVGEWHTHPWGRPYLSRTDKASVRKTADAAAVGLPCPVAIVLAPTGIPAVRKRLTAYVWDPVELTPREKQMLIFPLPRSHQAPQGGGS